eukprot:TRINITY_DN61311_c0_g1_i1.p1 TRINITY_DN61311_c0_g1~~TRINITY_DN61311_c0_g1_i1.p1  ORF type:complete len:1043 (+),score=237.92 TRINITY_DN61311_c0_g1_i1:158-3130(+)
MASDDSDEEDKAVQLDQGSLAEGLANLEKHWHAVAVFHECSYDFVEHAVSRVRKVLLRPGQEIVKRGSATPRSMYVVTWGAVEVRCEDQVCASLTQGDTFGEAMMLGLCERWSTTAVSKTSALLCEFTSANLQEILHDFPEETEYFSSLADYYAIRNEEWNNEDGSLFLRHAVSLRQASKAFLDALEATMERRLIFQGDCLCKEGEEASSMAFLCDGEVVMELSDRVVRHEEVPAVMTAVIAEDTSAAYVHRHSSVKASVLEPAGAAGFEDQKAVAARCAEADRMLQEALAECGPEQGHDVSSLPEAQVFGEEVLLGVSHVSTYTVRARKMCDVRLLHRQCFLRVLRDFPEDAKLLQRHQLQHEQAFPALNCRESAFLHGLGCSEEFFTFLGEHVEERVLFPGDDVRLDNLDKYVHRTLLVPHMNASFCRINVGKVQVTFPPGYRSALDGLQNGTILGPGSRILGSWCWAGAQFRALQVCYLSVLHRGVVSKALEELPMDRERALPAFLDQEQMDDTSKVKPHKQERVAKILRERSIFANTSQDFLEEILEYGNIRVFMPGDRIIEQGAEGSSMFIMSMGTANVVKEQISDDAQHYMVRTLTNIGALAYGGVFGELVMLGVQTKRSASIVASSLCCTLEVEQARSLSILERHPVERANFFTLVEEHLKKLAVPRIIYHQLFSGFNQQFRTLIGVNCERKLFFPRETIVREGTTGDCMYIVNSGSAVLEVSHQHVMQIRGGSHFGFNCMVGSSDKEKYGTSVVAETMCQMLIVTRSSYQHALNLYPDTQEVAKRLEAEERVRLKHQMDGFQKLVQRRRGLRIIVEALHDGTNDDDKMSSVHKSLLQQMLKGWRQQVQRTIDLRKEDEQLRVFNDVQINNWLEKRKRQLEQIRERVQLERLVVKSAKTRGFPKGMQKIPPPPSMQALPPAPQVELAGPSPYMAPNHIWRAGADAAATFRRPPLSARQTRQLPPLGQNNCKEAPVSTSKARMR